MYFRICFLIIKSVGRIFYSLRIFYGIYCFFTDKSWNADLPDRFDSFEYLILSNFKSNVIEVS